MIIGDEQVALFSSLFGGRTDVYGTYDVTTGRARQVKAAVTPRVVASHLLGRQPYGIYLLQGDAASAAAVDFDQEDTAPPSDFIQRLMQVGIPAYIERSKSKGYHAWVFAPREGVKARTLRALLRAVLSAMRMPSVEVFPKQDSLSSTLSYGNFINAPLFGTLVPMGRTVFLDASFHPIADQWDFMRTVRRVTANEIAAACARIGCSTETPAPTNNNVALPRPPASYSLMPCAQRMLCEGTTENQRIACFRLAAQLRKVGLPYEYAFLVLTRWAEKNRPADGRSVISDAEIASQAKCAYRGRMFLSCGCDDPSVAPFCTPGCPIRRRRDAQPSSTSRRADANEAAAVPFRECADHVVNGGCDGGDQNIHRGA